MGFLDNAGLGTLWKNIVGKSVPYGYCTTGASTRAKVVTVSPAITELTAGVQIAVKFQYANTAVTTSSAVTLNVNGLGAKDIKRYGSTNISNSGATSWNANSVVILTYDGSYWQLTDYNNTTYSGMTDAEVNAGTSGTNRLITPARLKYAIQHWSTGEANVQSDWSQTDDTADDYIKNKPTIPSGSSPYTSDPSMDGTASAGSSDLYARGDHVHPSDTSRVPTTRTVNGHALSSNVTVGVSDITVPRPVGQQSIDLGSWITSAEGLISSLDEQLADKVDAEDGKGLSTNDYTTTEKNKLAGIASGAEVNVNADWNATSGDAQILNKPTIPTKTSDLTNDSGFITSPTRLDLVENWTAPTATLVVNGSTASLNLDNTEASPYTLMTAFNSIAGVRVIQIVGGSAQAPQARVYEIADADLTNCTVRLVSVDDGVIYTADLSAEDFFGDLTGTFSSQTIPTGGITTETDPTVPAWAKASSKPSYEADEISFSVPQAYEVGNATDVEGAILDLDEAVANAKSTASSAHTLASDALPKSGGQLTGDLTLYVASGNSPGLIFQRGTLTDNYNDWKIYDKSGFLYFAQRGSGSSAFGDMGYIDTSGVLHFNIAWGSVTGKPTIPSKTSDLTNDSGFIRGVSLQGNQLYPDSNGWVDVSFDASGVLYDGQGTEVPVYDALDDLYTKTLPSVTASDNGKVLRVVNGAWSAVALPSASGVSF